MWLREWPNSSSSLDGMLVDKHGTYVEKLDVTHEKLFRLRRHARTHRS